MLTAKVSKKASFLIHKMRLNLLHRVEKDKLMYAKYLEQQVLYKVELRFRGGFVFNENINRLRCYSHERLNREKVYANRKGWSGFTVKPVGFSVHPTSQIRVKRSDTYRISIWKSSETILESGSEI